MSSTVLEKAVSRHKRRSDRAPWEEPPTALGQAGKGTAITLVLAVVLVPLWTIVVTSLSPQSSINKAGGLVVVPDGITFAAYRRIFDNELVMHSLWVSIWTTVVGTILSLVATILCAYGLAYPRSFAHRTILGLLIVTMFFNGGLIPFFLVVSELGGYDQYWSLIVPASISVFNIIVMRGFFANTAQELMDAAKVDGAGHWRTLWSVVLPTSKPVVAVIALFYGVGYWNTWFNALLFLPGNEKWPLQMVLYTYTYRGNPMPNTGMTATGQYYGNQEIAPLAIQMAVVVLTLVPILLVYPFIQRHFAKGMLLGAIKG
jgi:multiple sugar transport system permease protein/putative aldouronate transport system permease protein